MGKHVSTMNYFGQATKSQFGPVLPTNVFPSGHCFASIGQAFITGVFVADFVGIRISVGFGFPPFVVTNGLRLLGIYGDA